MCVLKKLDLARDIKNRKVLMHTICSREYL